MVKSQQPNALNKLGHPDDRRIAEILITKQDQDHFQKMKNVEILLETVKLKI
jgi:hypothetical protein